MGRYIRDKVNHVDIPVYGSGGHTIKNQSGTEFTQRKNLKFNNATVVDDPSGNATVITPTGDPTNFYGTIEEWEALTQAQKDAYDSVDLIDDYTDVTDELEAVSNSVNQMGEQVEDITEQISDLKTDVDSIPRVVIKTLTITNKTADAAGNIALNPLSINNCIPLAFTPNSVGRAIRSWRFGSYNNTLYLIWSNGNETISGTVYYIDK